MLHRCFVHKLFVPARTWRPALHRDLRTRMADVQEDPFIASKPGEPDIPLDIKGGRMLAPIPGLYQYIVRHSSQQLPGLDILNALHKESMNHPISGMCSPPDSVPLLQFLVRAVNAKKIVECGVFSGYTALAMALALPDGGKLYACDITDEYPSIGKPFWETAGVRDKIDLRIGPAVDTLDELLKSEGEGSIDFGFIDANKDQYDEYYEKLLLLLRPGGIIVVDNVLWDCRVLDPNPAAQSTKIIKALNDKLVKDDRVYICMLPVSDGVTLVLKK